MDRSGIRDDVAPWSFFLPMTLAVALGGLLAGLALRMVDRVFAPESDAIAAEAAHRQAPAPAEASNAVEPAPQAPAVPASAPDAAATVAAERPRTRAGVEREASTADGVPVLPGAIVAKRDGAPEACIHGSIARRAENGWEQRLENDAPVRCIEASALR